MERILRQVSVRGLGRKYYLEATKSWDYQPPGCENKECESEQSVLVHGGRLDGLDALIDFGGLIGVAGGTKGVGLAG
jgi:hypothetical protein